jgi:hypothetical protein
MMKAFLGDTIKTILFVPFAIDVGAIVTCFAASSFYQPLYHTLSR